MKNYIKITQFSQMTGVTVRTLHHYDRIGLLRPGMRTPTGYRYYTRHEMIRLQQISTLKFLGFSLNQIKVLLSKGNKDPSSAINWQIHALNQRIREVQSATELLTDMAMQLKANKPISDEQSLKLIKIIRNDEKKIEQWVQKHPG